MPRRRDLIAVTAPTRSVYGGYQPFSGDFDGDGAGDVLWYSH